MGESISKQLVIARYEEDISWAKGFNAFVYDKGRNMLPNVGREAHTYLFHIVRWWNSLADFTVFSQGNPIDHVGPNGIQNIFEVARGIVGHMLCINREWDEHGKLRHWGKWEEDWVMGKIKNAKLTMAEWFHCYLDYKILPLLTLPYFPGAIFGVSREAIKRRPKAIYERLLESLSHHENPEEAYYMERAWIPLLWSPGIELTVARMGVSNTEGRLQII